ncbi:MAG: hydrogenase [Candidatus Methanomethylophilaceae archaeon]|nr:hydrogenase [Candidatus Methanomethylophilaceae archaeon]
MENAIIGNMIDLCAVMMLLTTVLAVAMTHMKPLIRLFSAQSLFLAVLALIVAYSSGTSHIYIMCGLTLVLKVFVMPRMLWYIMDRINVGREVGLSLGIPGTLLASGLMMVLSYYITEPLLATMHTVERNCLALSVSILLIGLLMMCTRKNAITETIGLLMMENGLFLGAVALSHGMPLIVEIAAFFDVMVAVIIIGIFAHRINRSFNSVDTSFLRRLRE